MRNKIAVVCKDHADYNNFISKNSFDGLKKNFYPVYTRNKTIGGVFCGVVATSSDYDRELFKLCLNRIR